MDLAQCKDHFSYNPSPNYGTQCSFACFHAFSACTMTVGAMLEV